MELLPGKKREYLNLYIFDKGTILEVWNVLNGTESNENLMKSFNLYLGTSALLGYIAFEKILNIKNHIQNGLRWLRRTRCAR